MLSGDIPYKDLEKTAIIHKSQTGELSTLPIAQLFPGQYKLLLNSEFKSCMIIRTYATVCVFLLTIRIRTSFLHPVDRSNKYHRCKKL